MLAMVTFSPKHEDFTPVTWGDAQRTADGALSELLQTPWSASTAGPRVDLHFYDSSGSTGSCTALAAEGHGTFSCWNTWMNTQLPEKWHANQS